MLLFSLCVNHWGSCLLSQGIHCSHTAPQTPEGEKSKGRVDVFGVSHVNRAGASSRGQGGFFHCDKIYIT